ncbi:unnamed protein product [Polarella glacialis]|uniref:PUM-HD domain-containing protein n=1 Tax=Polarella glacialis TaxID=89957 RepID=A0A813GWE7_POLGL|nr:unnamed protein product [Polarella glacialis]
MEPSQGTLAKPRLPVLRDTTAKYLPAQQLLLLKYREHPRPLGASGSTIAATGLLIPTQLINADPGLQGRAGIGTFWTWMVAGAGGAWHGIRQNREPRTRRNRPAAARVTGMMAERQVSDTSYATDIETAWQTDESSSQGSAPAVASSGRLGVDVQGSGLELEESSGLASNHDVWTSLPRWPRGPSELSNLQSFFPSANAGDRCLFDNLFAVHQTGCLEEIQPYTAQRLNLKWASKECDAAVKQLKSPGLDEAQRQKLMERIVTDAWSMAVTKQGTRLVQVALEVADAAGKLTLAAALRGRVWQALKSPHANHVLQKIITVLPPAKCQFVLSELRGKVFDAARHPFGCRVLERLLEHCAGPQTEVLAAEVLKDVLELCRHPYGNYVVQHTLEHGTQEQRRQLCEAMKPEASRLARHKVASHVVECALLHSLPEDRQSLKEALVDGNSSTVSSNKIHLLNVVVNSIIAKNNSKTSNQQQKEKSDRGEMLLEPTVSSYGECLICHMLLVVSVALSMYFAVEYA